MELFVVNKESKYNLDRFLLAQQRDYDTALREIKNGRKVSHWMWYIFPQIKGLGYSSMAHKYAIQNLDEAKAYMANPTLRKHLLEISEALLTIESSDAVCVMGSPDHMKLKSSMTLFAIAVPEYDVFQKVLDKFYLGQKDKKTLSILEL